MATAMTGARRNQRRAMQQVMKMLFNSGKQVFGSDGSHSGNSQKRPTVWYHVNADPAVDPGDQATYSVEKGDWVLREDAANEIESLWICTVAPAAAVTATFVEVIA